MILSGKQEVGKCRSETSCALFLNGMAIKVLGGGLLSEGKGVSVCYE
jgi:hypothetical protein